MDPDEIPYGDTLPIKYVPDGEMFAPVIKVTVKRSCYFMKDSAARIELMDAVSINHMINEHIIFMLVVNDYRNHRPQMQLPIKLPPTRSTYYYAIVEDKGPYDCKRFKKMRCFKKALSEYTNGFIGRGKDDQPRTVYLIKIIGEIVVPFDESDDALFKGESWYFPSLYKRNIDADPFAPKE